MVDTALITRDVEIRLSDSNGQLAVDMTLIAVLSDDDTDGVYAVHKYETSILITQDGMLFPLWPNTRGSKATHYQLYIQHGTKSSSPRYSFCKIQPADVDGQTLGELARQYIESEAWTPQAKFPDGAAAAPGLVLTSNPTTGFYADPDGDLAVSRNGVPAGKVVGSSEIAGLAADAVDDAVAPYVATASDAADDAAAARDIASAQADISTVQAGLSQAAAVASQASADVAAAASVAGRTYLDITSALTDGTLAIGERFNVIVTGGLNIYQKDAGPSATGPLSSIPNAGRVTDLEDMLGITPTPGEDMVASWAVLNNDGVPVFEGDYDGGVLSAPITVDPQSSSTTYVPILNVANLAGTVSVALAAHQDTGVVELVRPGETEQEFDDDEWPDPFSFSIVDEDDNELFSVNLADGTVYFVPGEDLSALITGIAAGGISPVGVSSELIPGNVSGGQRYDANLARFRTDASGQPRDVIGRLTNAPVYIEEGRDPLELHIGMGDSTSQGSNGDTLRITDALAPNTCVALSTGIRGTADVVFDPDLVTDFVPAKEAVSAPLGSTGWVAFGQYLESAQITGPRKVVIVHTAGKSGSVLSEQQEGGTFFENSIVAAEKTIELADVYGRTVIPARVWLMDGANDRSASVTLAAFKNGLVSMQASYTTRLNAAFGVTGEKDLMIAQTCGAANILTSPGKDAAQIAQAQYEAVLENAHILMYVSEYIFKMAPGNAVHGDAYKYDLMGEYRAKAELARRRGESIFCPIADRDNITVVGSVVSIPFKLVKRPGTSLWYPLQFTTAFRTATTNHGFAATGSRTIASTPVIVGDGGASTGVGVVQITLSGPPATGDAIEYCYTGYTSGIETDYPATKGNLMDAAIEVSVTAPGVILLNPASAFRKVF